MGATILRAVFRAWYSSGGMSNPPVSTEPVAKPPRKMTPFRVAGIGCGAVAAFALLFFVIGAILLGVEWSKPYRPEAEVAALAGVPLYPGATIDEGATRTARATAIVLRGLYPADSTTVVGLRTGDNPETQIVPFYDAQMARLGFTKTRLGGGGTNGASYAGGNVTVVIQTRDEPGEDRQLLVMRFDVGIKKRLGVREDIVTPEDFKKN